MECKVERCKKKGVARGMCQMHYRRWKLYGDPLKTKVQVAPKGATLKQKLLLKTEKTKKCWNWTGSRFQNGYGSMRFGSTLRGVHRVSWEIHNGSIPEGICVLHKCDNKLCVRPGHLFLGTHADNVADMDRKGRRCRDNACRPKGEKHYNVKLTEKDVKEIRASSLTYKQLSEIYGISTGGISDIKNYYAWKHIK